MILNANIWSVHPLHFRLFLPKLLVNSCLDSSKKDSIETFAGDGQECDSSPVVRFEGRLS